MFRVNNKDMRKKSLASFWCLYYSILEAFFYYWLWACCQKLVKFKLGKILLANQNEAISLTEIALFWFPRKIFLNLNKLSKFGQFPIGENFPWKSKLSYFIGWNCFILISGGNFLNVKLSFTVLKLHR